MIAVASRPRIHSEPRCATRRLLRNPPLRLPLPPIHEQECIAAALEKADDQIDATVEKEALLIKLKRGLMQDLLTGNVRVPATLEVARS